MSRILFVDDMRECYQLFMAGLPKEHYVYWAQSREEAEKQLEDQVYDLVISDYHLTDADPEGGLEVISKASSSGLPVLSISKENHREEALSHGAKKFNFKRDFFSNVEARIAEVLENER